MKNLKKVVTKEEVKCRKKSYSGGAHCPHDGCARAPGAWEGEGGIRRSCDIGVGGFILVTLGCWFHCRYNYAKLRIQERLAREGIKNKILYESTHLDPERKQTNGGSTSN
ncbi:cytochrome c oxidase assembly protein COX20, mitochondrial-like [Physeter macrocephalus]|uniref:Cytochrome c oxidase assembly protein COX20, mitochondrial n=1 Tax=Physeter macrocephalus TaxID=9755 RepID=A0A2Y9THM9_PHYMC|nr:cytochrome c oxidase assembly protein COX20, mitochondrial-like [Physeter catodon]|eukprot:XP_023987814.1 cytochrome c oxidase assembly protein COX20, mitochondrial-like [Physeter catodon]